MKLPLIDACWFFVEDARIVVTSGAYTGRVGKVLLTYNGKRPVTARLLGVRPDRVRVALETTGHEESIALLLPTTQLARLETDQELTVRISRRYGHILRLNRGNDRGNDLDTVARHLHMPRLGMPL